MAVKTYNYDVDVAMWERLEGVIGQLIDETLSNLRAGHTKKGEPMLFGAISAPTNEGTLIVQVLVRLKPLQSNNNTKPTIRFSLRR